MVNIPVNLCIQTDFNMKSMTTDCWILSRLEPSKS